MHLYSLACKKQKPYEEAQEFIVKPTAIALVAKTLHLVNQLYMMRTVSGYMLCSRQAINQLKVSIELSLKVSSSSSFKSSSQTQTIARASNASSYNH